MKIKLLNKKTLFVKVSISVSICFAIIFGICLTGVELYKNIYLTNATSEHFQKQSESADLLFSNTLYDIASNNESMFNDENIEEFKHSENKKNYLSSLIKNIGLSNKLYFDVSTFYQGQFYNANNDLLFVSSDSINLLNKNPNTLNIIGSKKYEDRILLIVGIKNDEVYTFYMLNEDVLASLISINISNTISFITNSNNDIIISNNSELLNQRITDFKAVQNYKNNKYYCIHSKLSLTSNYGEELIIHNYIPYDYVFGSIILVEIIVLTFLSLSLLGGCVLALLNVKKVSKPIKELSDQISNVDLENINIHQKDNLQTKNEIDILENSYYKMLDKIQKLLLKQEEDFNLQRKLELDSLQTQINPHFLYNVLDTIAWMAKLNKQKNIEEFTINLAKFYRLSLHKGEKYITIKEEIDIIHYFLAIQLQRYPDLFTYTTFCDEKIQDNMTLKLILQPFVENAIKYAFNYDYDKMKVGEILVSAKEKDNDYIEFVIKDNGIGFNVTKISKNKEMNSPNGFGIKNVKERLKLEYKDSFKFKITSKKNVGTTIRIIIPKNRPSS